MTGKDVAKVGVAVLLMGGAAALFFLRGDEEPPPETEETQSYWYDPQEKKGFALTAEQSQTDVRLIKAERAAGDDSTGPIANRMKHATLTRAKSPFTGEWSGVPARKCEKCQEIFAAEGADGEAAVCPKCGWDPMER